MGKSKKAAPRVDVASIEANTVTEEELRALAEAGDVEAQEALDDAAAEAHRRDVLGEAYGAEQFDPPYAEPLPAVEGEQGQATLDRAAYAGERVLTTGADQLIEVATVRVANGQGVVTLEDGRVLRRSQYEVLA